jgi:hypothetical protein
MMHRAFRHRRVALALLLVTLIPATHAAIRGRGRYVGYVLFDRWDTCILFNGTYVMYISTAVKESLRPYAGRSVAIDARQVEQPRNPGDGLIKQYFINEVDLPPNPLEHAGLAIHIGVVEDGQSAALRLRLENRGAAPISIGAASIAFAVFAKTAGSERPLSDPSDGSSSAVITRQDLEQMQGRSGFTSGDITRNYEWRVDKAHRLPSNFQLSPNASKSTVIHLKLPLGEYQAIAGASGGVLQSSPLVSETVNFDVTNSGQIVAVH